MSDVVKPVRTVESISGNYAEERVVAEKDVTVQDPVLGFDRQIVAGTQVPADLLDAYRAETGGTVSTDQRMRSPVGPDEPGPDPVPVKAERAPARDKAQRAPARDK